MATKQSEKQTNWKPEMCLAILHFVVELGMGKKEADLLWGGRDNAGYIGWSIDAV